MRHIILIGFTNRSARTTINNNGGDDLQEQFVMVTDDAQAHRALAYDSQGARLLNLGEHGVTSEMLAVLEARFHKAASIQAAIRWLREEAAAKASAAAGAQLVSPAAKYRSPIRDRDGYEDFND